MKYFEFTLESNPVCEFPVVKRSSLTEDRAYHASMAKNLIGSLGAEEAARCARRHHWVGLLPFVLAERQAICLNR